MSKTRRTLIDSIANENAVSAEVDETGIVGTVSVENITQEDMVQLLTHIYTEPLDAAVRETISNAWDAQKRAGNDTDPITISLVRINESSSLFSVRDFGCGMTLKELSENFFSYNNSDKGMKFEERGGFGLGAKSPLALAGEMTVISVKNRTKIKAEAVLNSSTNTVVFNELGETDEPDGTLVSFKVNSSDANEITRSFNQEGFKFMRRTLPTTFSKMLFRFWETVPLMFNGKLIDLEELNWVKQAQNDKYDVQVYGQVGERVWVSYNRHATISSRTRCEHVYLNVGGVCYQLSDNEKINSALKEHFGAELELGIEVPTSSIIRFTPARDNIIYDDITVQNICSLIEERALTARNGLRVQLSRVSEPDKLLNKLFFHRGLLAEPSSNPNSYKLVPFMVRGKDVSKTCFTKPYGSFSIKSSWDGKASSAGLKKLDENTNFSYSDIRHTLYVLIRVPNVDKILTSTDDFKELSLAARTYRKTYVLSEDLTASSYYAGNRRNRNSQAYYFINFLLTEEPLEEVKNGIYLDSFELEDFLNQMKTKRADAAAAHRENIAVKDEVKDILVLNVVDNEVAGSMKSASELKKLDEVIIINDKVDGISEYYETVKSFYTGESETKFWHVRTKVEATLRKLTSLYPGAHFVILQKSRKNAPLIGKVPNARTVLSKLVETIGPDCMEIAEKALIHAVWEEEIDTIMEWSHRDSSVHQLLTISPEESKKYLAVSLIKDMKKIREEAERDTLTNAQLNLPYTPKHLNIDASSIWRFLLIASRCTEANDYSSSNIQINSDSVYSFIPLLKLRVAKKDKYLRTSMVELADRFIKLNEEN